MQEKYLKIEIPRLAMPNILPVDTDSQTLMLEV